MGVPMAERVDPLSLGRALIRCPSVTPADAGALDVLQATLEGIGFRCIRLPFAEPGAATVDNLYARLGQERPNFCFAGHTDVVPPGDAGAWSSPPFAAEIRNGRLYGRGAADMKCAIACFVAAAARFLADRSKPLGGSLSLLITGDEEGPAVNGTAKVLNWLDQQGEVLDACLVGEPTNPHRLGEMIKIGRRGSLNGRLTVFGTQGHAAYPHLADNPIPRLMRMLDRLNATPLDQGSDHFQPSTLTITSIDVGNTATNVLPATARAAFNIRFNDQHTENALRSWVEAHCRAVGGEFEVAFECSGEPFLCPPGPLSDILTGAIAAVVGGSPELSTSGGTSDARFIRKVCPVVEFGMPGATAHKIDENVAVADIEALTDIYRATIERYFGTAR